MTGRGGQYTYHGPGQRVGYVMMNLKARGGDVRAFVQRLERWLILALGHFGVTGEVRAGRVGVWVERHGADGAAREDKIA
ncbi:lipoyl protein ligase domain-containing protein, partial [Streptomyces scabiei]